MRSTPAPRARFGENEARTLLGEASTWMAFVGRGELGGGDGKDGDAAAGAGVGAGAAAHAGAKLKGATKKNQRFRPRMRCERYTRSGATTRQRSRRALISRYRFTSFGVTSAGAASRTRTPARWSCRTRLSLHPSASAAAART